VTDVQPAAAPRTDNLTVVGIGGDIGMYALCRAFHEQYGALSVVLSTVATRAMKDSAFVENVVVPGLDDTEVLLEALEDQAERLSDRTLILLTNSDWHVATIVAHRERLAAAGYHFSYPSAEVLRQVSSKDGFAEVCAQVGIDTPKTVPVNIPALGGEVDRTPEIPFSYPLIAKPADSSQWQNVHFPGKLKVHELDSQEELQELIAHLVRAEYPGTLLVQEFIPGDETQIRSLTAYRDSAGKVTLLASGRVLLEEHTPGTLGIPSAILVEQYPEAMAAAEWFLEHVGYTGFANFDFKQDPETGREVFFEVNPRVGRNNYYVTGSGANVAKALVEDVVLGNEIPQLRPTRDICYCVVPFDLLCRYITDRALLARLKDLKRHGAVVNPLRYSGDSGLRRRLITEGIIQNYRRKYRQYFPPPRANSGAA